MSTLSELLGEHTGLTGAAADHLQELVGEWQLLADLSFADYRLWVPVPEGLLCVAQVRPTTAHTSYPVDAGRAPCCGHPSASSCVRRWPSAGCSPRTSRTSTRASRCGGSAVPGDLRRPGGRGAQPGHQPGRPSRRSQPAGDRLPAGRRGAVPDDRGRDVPRARHRGRHPHQPTRGPTVSSGWSRPAWCSTPAPTALSAYHRMGLPTELVGTDLAQVTRTLITDPFDAEEVVQRIRSALAGDASLRIEADARRCHRAAARRCRCAPTGCPGGRWCWWRDVTEVRSRDPCPAQQGRHHPGDPPPGEEQPADGGCAAPAAGAALGQRRGAHRAHRVRAPGRLHRTGARHAVDVGGRAGRPGRRHRPAGADDGRRRLAQQRRQPAPGGQPGGCWPPSWPLRW
ncbi:histidine kinase N-terminal domain-containing protein [Rhodococcus sp. X156]|uniref:histidine kinase N-terminal domain-containing protein n=1 Tax=Rhodococcus sp. X156 TaxID=2499145 RepID=UPI000FD83D07|nr:histidine kinase N-terminal domain-containing protein [Rhodococcus sp. X156]